VALFPPLKQRRRVILVLTVYNNMMSWAKQYQIVGLVPLFIRHAGISARTLIAMREDVANLADNEIIRGSGAICDHRLVAVGMRAAISR
jgi:hypothetical protein